MASTERKTSAELTAATLIAAVLLIVVVLAAVVVLELANKSPNNVLLVVGTLAGPVVLQLVQARKIDANSEKLAEVHKNTNGRLDGALGQKTALEQQLLDAGIRPVTLPSPRASLDDAAATGGAHRGEP